MPLAHPWETDKVNFIHDDRHVPMLETAAAELVEHLFVQVERLVNNMKRRTSTMAKNIVKTTASNPKVAIFSLWIKENTSLVSMEDRFCEHGLPASCLPDDGDSFIAFEIHGVFRRGILSMLPAAYAICV